VTPDAIDMKIDNRALWFLVPLPGLIAGGFFKRANKTPAAVLKRAIWPQKMTFDCSF
jgi:hypothetical protein